MTLLGTPEAQRLAAAVTLVLLRYGEDHPVFDLRVGELGDCVRVDWGGAAPGTTLNDLATAVAELQPSRRQEVAVLLTASLPRPLAGPPTVVLHPGTPLANSTTDDRFTIHVHLALEVLDTWPASTAISAIDLVSATERAEILSAGRSALPSDPPTTIHEAISRQAAARPDSEAISDGSVRMTFRELERAADRFAVALQRLGVERGSQVGVCLPRTAEAVVVLLAVLKSGAAYVPLDPAYPADRLTHAVADTGMALLVCDVQTTSRLPDVRSVTPAQLAVATTEGTPLRSVGDPGDPAYTIYTSGSTGRPKGVVVPHRNVAALVNATREEFGLDRTDVWTLFHSVTFDFSIWEMWGCLMTGGRLVVVPYFVSRSAEDFHLLLVRERVTVLSQTPSAFWALQSIDAGADDELAVRLIVLGGETLDPGSLDRWFAAHPGSACRVENMYGITETTVHVTRRTVTPQDLGSGSVGAALPGWGLSIRDPEGRVLPFGAVGEIHVSGAGLADRYLNRPELTAERFVEDAITGERCYRSGDLGRLHKDGTLDHLGRLDDQVKLRGFRIELGEVRAALIDVPGVRAAAVVKEAGQPDDPSSARLAGYVVLDAATTVLDVRRAVAERLPEHMVPAAIIEVTDLPLTANGKLDRAALTDRRTAEAVDDTLASGTLADKVLKAWRVVSPGASADDDWFENGGNSLQAVKLVRVLQAGSGLPQVNVRDLYRHPSPTKLAQLMEARLAGQAG